MNHDVLARERDHHDRIAAGLDPAAMPPRAPDAWEQAILDAAGDLRGREVLELGCGDGSLSLALLERGARLTALDLSPGMVAVARARAERFAPDASALFLAASAERSGLEDAAFDVIVGKWVLHHLDLPVAAGELRRLLRPGGRAVFAETSGLNPVLRAARRRLTGRCGVARVGTEDEQPLGARDVEVLRSRFTVAVAFPVFQLLQIFDRQVLRYRWPVLTRACARADAVLGRIPGVRRWGHWLQLTLT